MRLIILVLLVVLRFSEATSQTITSIGSGDWNDPGSWDLARVPADGDDIIIDTGHTVAIDGTPDITLDAVTLTIDGVLDMTEDGLNEANLTMTGYSGILLRGQILDNVSDLVPAVNLNEGESVINVDGDIIWSACEGDGAGDPVCFTEYTIFYSLVDPDPDNYSTQDGSGSPILMPASNNPLPVVLTYFNVSPEPSGFSLEWATSSEINNQHFEIERSENGREFYVIGKVDGHGTTTIPEVYSFMDWNPIQETEFYRLKQVDFDGEFELLGVEIGRSNYFKEIDSRIFPNPSKSGGQLVLRTKIIPTEIRLLHIDGKTNWDLSDGIIHSNNGLELQLPMLTKGLYAIRFVWPDGRIQHQKLFVE